MSEIRFQQTPENFDAVLNSLRAFHPDLSGFWLENHGDGLNAAESYNKLYLLFGLQKKMSRLDFPRDSITHHVMEAIENALYISGWADRTWSVGQRLSICNCGAHERARNRRTTYI